MSDDKFHFQIPDGNIRNQEYNKTGGSPRVDRDNHREHGFKLQAQSMTLKRSSQNKTDFYYTEDMYLQISTPSEVSLKSQAPKIEHLGFEIISYSKKNSSVGSARIKKNAFGLFEEKLEEYISSEDNVGKTYFSPIEDIESIPTEEKIKDPINSDLTEEISIVINLFNVLALKERIAINASIVEELKKYTDNVSQRNFSNGITSIECKLKANQIPGVVSEFSTIKEVKLNQTFFVKNSMPAEPMPNPLQISAPKSNSPICIIDSGISDANGIFTKLIKGRVQYLPMGSVDASYDHGTFVASRCVFGDEIDSCISTHKLEPYATLYDVQVFGVDSSGKETYPTEFGLRSAVEDVVIANKDSIKVYNLSLAAPDPISNLEITELAKLLDYLSKEHKVLFIVAAGNIDNKLGDFPLKHFSNPNARIGCPAESLLCITVGSIAKFSNSSSLSIDNCLSPFSKIGPGSDLGIKPELVAHGGNLIEPYSHAARVSTYGIGKDGKNLAVDIGTSFSAPLVACYAQQLFDYYPHSDPNLVKGLLCHFSEPRQIHKELGENARLYLGFGEPNIESAIRAGDFNAAYIYEGKLDQDNYQFVSFHVPSTMAHEIADSSLTVKVTISYDPPVNPDNETEYSNSRISAKLFKHTEDGLKGVGVSGDDQYNLPWNPVIQFKKSFSRSYLAGRWELRLRLYTRGDVQEDYLQDYSVVIEIIDEANGTDVYQSILEEYGDVYKIIEIEVAA